MTLLKKVGVIFDGFVNFLAGLGILVIIFFMVTIGLHVVLRYFFHNPISWVVQTTEYGIYSLVFLGAAWILRKKRHASLDILTNRLRPRSRAVLNMITSGIGAIVCLIFFFFGTQLVLDHFQRGLFEMKTWDVPTAPILALIPLGFLVLLIQFIRQGYGHLENWKAKPEEDQAP